MQDNVQAPTVMTPPPVPTAPPRPSFTLDKKDYVLAACALLISILGVSCALWGGFKLGFTVTLLLWFLVGTVYLTDRNTRLKPYALLCAVLALAGSLVFSLSANGTVNFTLGVVLFFLYAVWFDSLNGNRREVGDMGLLRNALTSTFGNAFGYASRAVYSVFGNKNTALKSALLGIACAAPVLFVVLPLLISSDAAFEGLISYVFGSLGSAAFKLALGVLLTPLLMGYCFAQKKEEKQDVTLRVGGGINAIGTSSFLGALALCYVTYLFSQLAYFTNAFGSILPADYTAAEYARRGFFEMAVIAAINFLIVFAALMLARKTEDGKTPLSVKLFTAFISLFTLVIVGTALSKMMMYIDRFGMTPRRITTSAFMVVLGITFIALLIRCFVNRTPVVRIALITASVVLLTLGLGNMDKYIAAYNVYAYQTYKLDTIDVQTIYSLGYGGAEYLNMLAHAEDETISDEAKYYLRQSINRLYSRSTDEQGTHTFTRRYTGLSAWNYSRETAYAVLEPYLAQYDTLTE